VTFLLLPLECMKQALLDAVEYIFGRLGAVELGQRGQERRRVDAVIVGLLHQVAHERRNFRSQFGNIGVGGALGDHRGPSLGVEAAPFARLGQYPARRYQAIGHRQLADLDGAGKAQHDPPFQLGQFHAARRQFMQQPGILILIQIDVHD
jgi:hypothetical protein